VPFDNPAHDLDRLRVIAFLKPADGPVASVFRPGFPMQNEGLDWLEPRGSPVWIKRRDEGPELYAVAFLDAVHG
jgi:hypothetical protein